MRLRPRPTIKETTTSPRTEDVPRHNGELPSKAQRLLGAKVQVNVSNREDSRWDEFGQLRKAEQKNLGSRYAAQRAPQIPLPSGMRDMPWSNSTASDRSSSDALLTPTASPDQGFTFSRNGSSTGVQTSQFYPSHQQSIESINREYYNASAQPLYVSQQTSASAVRDMALHKRSPKVHEMASDQVPARSAMKLSKASQNAQSPSNGKKPKKLDLASLFPRPGANTSEARLLSPANYTYSPSAVTDSTGFFPKAGAHREVRHPELNGRFETYQNSRSPLSEANSTPRVKIFEPDIYDNAKTHTRKPPKGIKNWFDGFDISSDEEEADPVELPANPPRPSVEAMPSDFSPYRVVAPERTSSKSNVNRSPHLGNGGLRPLDSTRPAVRRRMQSRGSESSTVTGDSGGHKRSGESRLTHSRLDSQSVLSLSSGSDDQKSMLSAVRDSRYAVQDEPTLGATLPSPSTRNLTAHPSSAQSLGVRSSDSTEPTSGSIPIRLRDSTAAPMAVDDWKDPAEANGIAPQPPKSATSLPGAQETRSGTTTRSTQDREGLKSAGGETSSSAPSDASHVMAVTEEEMMLLELMRKKRQAMQKNSFAEGYRLALKQEQDFLSKRRQSAHNSVSKMLQERANREGRFSPNSNPSDTQAEHNESEDQPPEQPPENRFSVFKRLPDIDRGFRIDRFLAMEAPQELPGEAEDHADDASAQAGQDEPQEERYVAKMARLERFLMMKPSLADAIQDDRPVSGTEIDTSTITATEDGDEPSPFQRLVGMRRENLRISSPLAEEYDEDESETPEDSEIEYDKHHAKVRAFLRASRVPDDAEDVDFTALPQVDAQPQPELRISQLGVLSSPISEDIEYESDESDRDHTPHLTPAVYIPTSTDTLTPKQPVFESGKPFAPPASKFQDRSHLEASPVSAPRELPSIGSRPISVSTGVASPLSQSFSASSPIDQALSEAAASRSPSYPGTPYVASQARRIHKMPTKIDTTAKTIGRITSMSSMTSAGEDVLAAWAELGGGSDALAARRRGR